MTEVINYVLLAWQQTSAWEMAAVFFAILYLLLVIKESIWCWPMALISTSLYIFIFFDVRYYMESGLQIFYIIMAIYGWWQWNTKAQSEDNLHISSWSTKQHLIALSLIAILVMISGFLLELNTDAAYPWLDSLTTWGAVVTTWMVTKKILENWIYWIVLDSIGIFLFSQKELYLTALLFIFYVILCFKGYSSWQKKLTDENASNL